MQNFYLFSSYFICFPLRSLRLCETNYSRQDANYAKIIIFYFIFFL